VQLIWQFHVYVTYLSFLDKSAEAAEPVQTAVLTEASLYSIHRHSENIKLINERKLSWPSESRDGGI